MADKQKLTFPVLRTAEVAACLSELCGRKVEEQQIAQPGMRIFALAVLFFVIQTEHNGLVLFGLNQPINQPINQSTNQPTNQSTNQPASPLIILTVSA